MRSFAVFELIVPASVNAMSSATAFGVTPDAPTGVPVSFARRDRSPRDVVHHGLRLAAGRDRGIVERAEARFIGDLMRLRDG